MGYADQCQASESGAQAQKEKTQLRKYLLEERWVLEGENMFLNVQRIIVYLKHLSNSDREKLAKIEHIMGEK